MLSQAARIHVVAFFVVAAALAGCAAHPPQPEPAQNPSPATQSFPKVAPQRALGVAERAAVVAVKQLGIPYRYGGSTRAGFDCSGLVHYAYSQAGVRTPRTTSALWRELAPVSDRHLQVGDVLFFDIAGKVSHVGLYLGDGRFVHAPSSGKEVTIASLGSDYYRRAFIRGGRPQ